MTSYSLLTSYAGQSLIQGFNFVSSKDSSGGFVSYQDYTSASAQGLVSINSNNQVILAADSTNTYNPDGSQGGRHSVRIESKASYNQGLVIGDFAHMPGSTCGAWPAFWMFGPDWPNDGEIDIIEGANMAYQNLVSAHTSSGCSLPSTGSWTGTQKYTDCSITDGCNYVPPSSDTSSYGDSFNAVGGGVYALLWSASALQVWHFPRGGVPLDVTSKTPDPSGWGPPQALFGGTGSCDVSKHFADMTIVLDIDFCGDYAGNLWGTGTCSGYAPTCETWVGNNPSKLKDMYWEVNYIDVYSPTTKAAASSSSSPVRGPSTAAQASSLPRASTTPARPVSTGATNNTAGPNDHASLVAASSISSRAGSPSAVASPSAGNNPAEINDFAYLGCFSSTSGYSAFTLSGTDSKMTLNECTNMCSSSKYAGVVNTQCYCANSLDAGTSSVADRSSCNTPCPGNSAQYCGSSSAGLRSLYINNYAVNSTTPPPAPAMAGNVTGGAVPKGSAATYSAGGGALPGAAAATGKVNGPVTITSTVVYTTVCSTNPAHLVPVTTTVTYCPTDPSDPSVPQATVTQSCDGCGVNKQSVVTLTIPLALVSSQAADPPAGSQVGSQANAPATATALYPVNVTTAPGAATWAPGATPTYLVPVQASAPKVSGLSVAMTLVACIYFAMFLI